MSTIVLLGVEIVVVVAWVSHRLRHRKFSAVAPVADARGAGSLVDGRGAVIVGCFLGVYLLWRLIKIAR